MEKLKTFLKSIGLDGTMIEKMVSEGQDFDPKTAAKSVKDVMRESLRNDEEFMDTVNNEVRGRVLSSKENKIMKLAGITKDELDALPKERRFDALVELAIERVKGTGGGDEATKAELERLRNKATTLTDELAKEKKEKEDAMRIGAQAREAVEVERDLQGHLAKKKLVIGVDDATEMTMLQLQKLYDIRRKEGKTQLYKKGTDLLATNPENERPMELGAAIDALVTERKWEQKSNGTADGDRHTTKDERTAIKREGPGAPKRELPGMAAAEAAAAARTTKKGTTQQ